MQTGICVHHQGLAGRGQCGDTLPVQFGIGLLWRWLVTVDEELGTPTGVGPASGGVPARSHRVGQGRYIR